MVTKSRPLYPPNAKLKQLRIQRSWSQQKVAEEIGTTMSQVSRWECGDGRPGIYYREKLCQLFDKTPQELEFLESQEIVNEQSPSDEESIKLPLEFTTYSNATSKFDIQVIDGELGNNDVHLTQWPGNSHENIAQLLFNIGIWILSFAKQQGFWPHSEFLKYVVTALEGSNTMDPKKLSRRDALDLLVKLPMALIGVAPTANFFKEEEVVSFCATSVTACWSLFWAGEFSEVETALPTYFSQLTPLAQRSLTSQKTAAGLLSQAHQIASLLVLEKEDFGASLTHCKQASLYGQIAGDPNLQVASLIRKANSLFYRNTVPYLRRHTQILETYQEALQYVKDVTSLLRGRIYSGLASAQAVLGQKQDALRHIALAYEEFPEYPENDIGFLYTYTTHYILHFNEACAYLDFKQPQQAWDALVQAATFVPNEVSPRGLELQNYRVIISIAKGDLDQSCTHFEKMVASGLALNSDLHQNEAHIAYEKMQLKWPHEKRVKELEDLLRR